MEEQWLADRTMLQTLLRTQPQWRVRDLAEATGRSRSWVKKWRARLCAARPDDPSVLRSRSRARKQPPPQISPAVVARILEIRDHPPDNLQRTPGPETILYYLHRPDAGHARADRLPRSTRTIWRILHQHGRIPSGHARRHTVVARPDPLTLWQLDFKDASTVPPDPDGKQGHVVEVLNTVDAGSSLVVHTLPREDFTAETTLMAVAELLREHGLPTAVMFDRDTRFVGSSRRRDFPSPFVRVWLCLGVHVTVLPPRRPDLNCFVERYHRAYAEECLRVYRPGDLAAVREVTARYQQHYNTERPVRHDVAHHEWKRNRNVSRPRLVFKPVPNLHMHLWQRECVKLEVTSKKASSHMMRSGKGKSERVNANEPLLRSRYLRDAANG